MPTDFKIKNIARKRRGRRKIMDRKSTDRENRKDEDGKKLKKREREKREEAERKRERGGGGGKWENGKMEYMKNARERIEKGNKLGAKAAAAKKCPEKSERKGQVCKAFLDRAKRSR